METVEIMDDDPLFYRVYASTREAEVALFGWDEAQKEIFLRMQYEAQRRSYGLQYSSLVAEAVKAGGERIGRMMTALAERELVLVDIALLPEYRNRGFGSRLLDSIKERAAMYGLPLALRVLQDNPARRLYGRHGFQVTGERPPYIEMQWDGTGNINNREANAE